MKKYTLAQILEAWEAAYGEDMHTEYPGFIQRLNECASRDPEPSGKQGSKRQDTNHIGALAQW